MNLRATFATASLVFASTLTAVTYSMDVLADSVANQPIPANIAVRQNPIPATKYSIENGRTAYTDDCFGCHGPGEPIIVEGATVLSSAAIADWTDGELYWKVKHGHRDLLGKGGNLSSRQVWNLINYLRSE